jgi:hypothetical protein
MSKTIFKNKHIIKEICFKLSFRIEMIHDVYDYMESFQKSKTHNFPEDVFTFYIGDAFCMYLLLRENK